MSTTVFLVYFVLRRGMYSLLCCCPVSIQKLFGRKLQPSLRARDDSKYERSGENIGLVEKRPASDVTIAPTKEDLEINETELVKNDASGNADANVDESKETAKPANEPELVTPTPGPSEQAPVEQTPDMEVKTEKPSKEVHHEDKTADHASEAHVEPQCHVERPKMPWEH